MSHRPLALVSGLSIGDYLLWNWSLSHGHDVLALFSGLTLLPLMIAFLWLLALSIARLLARSTRRSRARPAVSSNVAERPPRGADSAAAGAAEAHERPAAAASSGKLAA